MKKLLLLRKIILIFLFTFSLLNLGKSQVTVNITADKDNTISSTTPDNNAGLSALRAGTTGGAGGNTIHRALLHFNLSSIPPGSKIDSATLTLYVFRVGNEATGVALHKLTENWGEGDATWSHAFFPDFTWTTEGGDFEPTATASTGEVATGSLVIPNLTEDVQSWVNDSAANFGWILKGADEDKTRSAKLIASREQPDETLRPVLSVTYTSTSVKLPTVSLAIDNNILKYAAPARINLNATASDEDGTITKVQFYSGTTLLHTDTAIPYDFEWTDVQAGNYMLTAKAFDNSGYVTTSNSIQVSVVDENISGEVDSSFGINGIVKTNLGKGKTAYTSTAIQSDGKIVVAGNTSSSSGTDFILIRYNIDGSIDSSFSKDEKLTDAIGSSNSTAIQSDGKIVVGGTTNDYPYSSILARFNIDGSLDSSFSGVGKKTIHELILYSFTILPDGRLVAAGGETEAGDDKDFIIIVYNPDGSLDSSFSGDGKQYIDFGGFDYATSVAIQKDGKIVVAGALSYEESFGLARLNIDGSLDKSFSNDGQQTTFRPIIDRIKSIAIGDDGKIAVSGTFYDNIDVASFIARYNPDGSLDSSFSDNGMELTNLGQSDPSLAIQSDGKIILCTSSLSRVNPFSTITRYNTDGNLDSSFSYDGIIRIAGFNARNIVIDNNKLYAVGSVHNGLSGDSTFGAIARYLLTAKQSKPPTVTLTIPYNIVKYSAPARIKLNAAVANVSGTIKKVRFYNGKASLHTETEAPYGFLWINVPAGNYTLTAKAYDNSGNETTSNTINVSVVEENVPPVVSIVSPVDDTTYTGPATIRLIADAKDPNDRISKVEFYSGTTLLRTEYYYPYTYTLTNVQPGTYTITAKATDDKGISTTSEPVTVTVTSATLPIVSSRPSSADNSTDRLSLKLSPNPAISTLQIFTNGLQQNKPSTISVISPAGVVMKTMQSNSLNKVVQLDVSSLVSGVYTVKVVSGDKIMYRQFVKL